MTYIEKLMKIEKENNNLYKLIANKLHLYIKNDLKIKSATEFAEFINVSNSLITKFVKFINIDDWSTLRYIHNTAIEDKYNIKKNHNNDIDKFLKLVEESRKIFLVGTSTNLYVNKDFASKLSRLDIWTQTPENKYEQIGLSKLLTKKDLLIINSISLQHSWMIDMMKTSHSKIIVITSNDEKMKKIDVDLKIVIPSFDYDSSPSRIFTTKTRRAILKIYDRVYEAMLEKPEYLQILKLTAYN